MCSVPLVNRFCRESYNDPLEVYQLLKQRGMHLVTVTDHDSIDAVECLRRYPDFFLSEEVSCTTSSGTHLHVGVYGISDRDHVQLARRANDFSSFLAYCDEHKLLFSVNHAFSALTGRRKAEDFEEFAARFPAVEILNGAMIAPANGYAREFARAAHKAVMGGSDSHTLAGLGKTYTEVPGARNAWEFLEGVRQCQARVEGESGNYAKLTRAVWSIGLSMMDEHPWAVVLAPLLAVIPVVTLANLMMEMAFAWRWGAHTARFKPAGAVRSAAYAVD